MNSQLPDRPADNATVSKKVDWLMTVLEMLVANSQCANHSRRLRRVEIALAAVLGSGLFGGLGYALLRFLR